MQQSDCWQRCRDWQPQFLRDNVLILGYHAWAGFTTLGRGIVTCRVESPPSDFQPLLHAWQFKTQFVPEALASACLQEFGLTCCDIMPLMQVIRIYDPHRELLLLVESNDHAEVYWLKTLKIAPAQCYQQVCDRADEFSPHVLPSALFPSALLKDFE
jgi:hypothetical protein